MFKIMLDTETITTPIRSKNDFTFEQVPYQIALYSFCDNSGNHYGSQVYFIRETLEYIYDCLSLDYTPQFAPKWLIDNIDTYYFQSISAKMVLSVILRLYEKYNDSFLAHNTTFDIRALDNLAHFAKNTSVQYNEKGKRVLSYYGHFDFMECMAYYPCAMDYKHARNVPNSPKGYATLKMDYLAPLLLDAKQTHDALSDCINQANIHILFKDKAKGVYSKGNIFSLMSLYHSLNGVPLFVGTFTLSENKDKPHALLIKK